MGGSQSKDKSRPEVDNQVPSDKGSQWRQTRPFKEEAKKLKNYFEENCNTELNITLVGSTGVGKSSLINSIFSISKGRIADKTSVKSCDLEGVGTHYFTGAQVGKRDLFRCLSFFDTMGFSPDNMGISTEQVEACLKGLLKEGHKFNDHDIPTEGVENTRPHCVLIVVNAEELDRRPLREWSSDKCFEVIKVVPEDVAMMIVITKVDLVCSDSRNDIELIFTSEKVETLVQKAKAIFGVQGNHVFPIINFVDEMEVNEEKSVPIMFLLKYALDFARDRKEKYMN